MPSILNLNLEFHLPLVIERWIWVSCLFTTNVWILNFRDSYSSRKANLQFFSTHQKHPDSLELGTGAELGGLPLSKFECGHVQDHSQWSSSYWLTFSFPFSAFEKNNVLPDSLPFGLVFFHVSKAFLE